MFCYSARATEVNQRCELLSSRTSVLSSTQLDGAQNLVTCVPCSFASDRNQSQKDPVGVVTAI